MHQLPVQIPCRKVCLVCVIDLFLLVHVILLVSRKSHNIPLSSTEYFYYALVDPIGILEMRSVSS